MTGVASADRVLNERGVRQDLDAFVVAASFSRDGRTAAFALGDGSLRLARPGQSDDWASVQAHDGAMLALSADTEHGGFVTGGDDGRFARIGADGAIREIARFGMKWVERVAAFADARTGFLACTVGKQVHLFDTAGSPLKTLTHPSSVTGIAFDAKGKRIAASHYNGASLWFVASKSDNPRLLEWKGSHIGVVISPDGDNVVTAMQENSLHGWNLSDSKHMRMTGYPSKTQAMSFTKSGKWLASSGAESIVIWPFFGGGPTGKAPTELAGGDNVTCTFVASHPQHEGVAAGFSDGLVVMADIATSRVLPIAGTGRGAVSAMAWNPSGTHLAFGSETGFAAIVDLSTRSPG